MTPDPDVEPVGFAATEGSGAIVRRRRNLALLVLAVALALAGLGGIAWFVVAQVEGAPGRGEAVAAGTVARIDGAAQPVEFEAEGDYTVWIELDSVTRSNIRDRIVAATNCEATLADGSTARFRGARQGSAVAIGRRETVGTFEAPKGRVALRCGQQPFGRYGSRFTLRKERPFFVTEGRPGAGWRPWVGLFGGIALFLLAFPAYGRWSAGTLRTR